MTAEDTFAYFRSLHRPGQPLALANAWDVASARIIEAAGAPAIATTSAGVAWSMGSADGHHVDRHRVSDLIARICGAVDVPVSADIEGGYADTAAGVADTVKEVIAAGAVGINLEDAAHGREGALLEIAEARDRFAAARSASDRLFINARIDTYLLAVGEPGTRLQSTLERAAAYLEAGASGIFVPGTNDAATIRSLVAGIEAPVNVLVGPGSPTVRELADLGVARISLGSSLAQAGYGLTRRAAREFLTDGSYDSLADPMTYGELNELFSE